MMWPILKGAGDRLLSLSRSLISVGPISVGVPSLLDRLSLSYGGRYSPLYPNPRSSRADNLVGPVPGYPNAAFRLPISPPSPDTAVPSDSVGGGSSDGVDDDGSNSRGSFSGSGGMIIVDERARVRGEYQY